MNVTNTTSNKGNTNKKEQKENNNSHIKTFRNQIIFDCRFIDYI